MTKKPIMQEVVGSNSVNCQGPNKHQRDSLGAVSAIVQSRRDGSTNVICQYLCGEKCHRDSSYHPAGESAFREWDSYYDNCSWLR